MSAPGVLASPARLRVMGAITRRFLSASGPRTVGRKSGLTDMVVTPLLGLALVELDRALAPEGTEEHHDDGGREQDVDEAAHGRGGDEPEHPEREEDECEEDECEGPQHDCSLRRRLGPVDRR